MRVVGSTLLTGALACWAGVGPLQGQAPLAQPSAFPDTDRLAGPSSPIAIRAALLPAPESGGQTIEPPSVLRATLASALLPGTGQWLLGKRRWMAYVSLEAAALLFHFERRQDGSRLRSDYQDLAWMVARSGTVVGRIDPGFEYYERVADFESSGLFDRDPAASGVQPELRTDTYNGFIWDLARGIYLGGIDDPTPEDPGYQEAVAYYQERAYDDRFLWDWEGRSRERVEYRGLIRASDEAFRTATVLAGVVVANHVLSAIDGFITARQTGASALRIRALPHQRSGTPTWTGAWDVSLELRRE